MKTSFIIIITYIVVILFPVKTYSQFRQTFFFTNVTNNGQLGSSTCWASSIETLYQIYYPNSKDVQCKLIEQSSHERYKKCCGLDCSYPASQTDAMPFDSLFLKLNEKFIGFSTSINISVPNFNRVDTTYRKIYTPSNYSISRSNVLPFESIKESFNKYNSPLCLWKFQDYANAHITSIVGYEHTKDTITNTQLKWLFVQDPWPLKNGSRYIMSYEFYKKPVLDILAKRYSFEPKSALFYNFKSSNPNIAGGYSDSLIVSIKRTPKNIVNEILSNYQVTALNQANDILIHLNKNSSDSLLKFVGLQRNKSIIDEQSLIKVISFEYLFTAFQDISATSVSTGNPFTPQNWFENYLILFSDENEMLITLNDVRNKKKKLAVMAIDTTKNKEWYVSRIEPFKTSIMSVIDDLNIDRKDIKSVIVNKAAGEYPDFFIVNYKSNKKPVYVDLSGQNELGLSVNTQGNTGIFKYQVSKIDEKNKTKIAAYLSPSFPNKDSSQTLTVTQACKDFIKSFNRLIRITPATILKMKVDQCPYTCDVFATNGSDFDSVANSPKISFISSFNIINDAYKNSFLVPLIDDSFRPTNSTVHLYQNIYSTPCDRYYKIDSTFHFSKKGFIDDTYQQIIFVPIRRYKTLPNKKFDITDYNRLQEYAISPFDMKEINPPFIESNEGYLATINEKDINSYKNKKSITGIVCDVVLKDSSVVQCYLFNRQSFTTSSPYMKWKK